MPSKSFVTLRSFYLATASLIMVTGLSAAPAYARYGANSAVSVDYSQVQPVMAPVAPTNWMAAPLYYSQSIDMPQTAARPGYGTVTALSAPTDRYQRGGSNRTINQAALQRLQAFADNDIKAEPLRPMAKVELTPPAPVVASEPVVAVPVAPVKEARNFPPLKLVPPPSKNVAPDIAMAQNNTVPKAETAPASVVEAQNKVAAKTDDIKPDSLKPENLNRLLAASIPPKNTAAPAKTKLAVIEKPIILAQLEPVAAPVPAELKPKEKKLAAVEKPIIPVQPEPFVAPDFVSADTKPKEQKLAAVEKPIATSSPTIAPKDAVAKTEQPVIPQPGINPNKLAAQNTEMMARNEAAKNAEKNAVKNQVTEQDMSQQMVSLPAIAPSPRTAIVTAQNNIPNDASTMPAPIAQPAMPSVATVKVDMAPPPRTQIKEDAKPENQIMADAKPAPKLVPKPALAENTNSYNQPDVKAIAQIEPEQKMLPASKAAPEKIAAVEKAASQKPDAAPKEISQEINQQPVKTVAKTTPKETVKETTQIVALPTVTQAGLSSETEDAPLPAATPAAPVAMQKPDAAAPGAVKNSVVFAADTMDVEPSRSVNIDQVAAQVADDPRKRLQIKSYASKANNSSSEARRIALKRGLAVRETLIEKGVPASKIDVRALGYVEDAVNPPDRVDLIAM